MLSAAEICTWEDTVPESWGTAILTPIPKSSGTPTPNKLRQLVLQNVVLKWLSTIILCQLEDLLAHLVPPEQKAFLRGRKMIDHVFHCKGAWHATASGCFAAVDFAKA